MDRKKLQPLTLKWLEQRFPNFFECSQTWVWWTRLKQQPNP